MERNRREQIERERRRRAAQIRAKKKKRRQTLLRLIVGIVIILLIVVVVLVIAGGNKKQTAVNEPEVTTMEEGSIEEVTTLPQKEEISVIAAGDVIGHSVIIEQFATENGFDFTPLFAPLKNDIQKADIAVVNMETPFGGPEVGPYMGYPSFNTPDEMGVALEDAGFDVVQLASNHSMDSGVAGLLHEIDFWKQHPNITTIGLNESEADRDIIKIVEEKGVKIAFLNYTYGLNGYVLPDENYYMLTLLEDANIDLIRDQISRAKEQADIVVVCPHWGTEYQLTEPDEFQTYWADVITEAGADVIIGTHPHVVEKMGIVEAGGNRALCYWSLGNFVTNQQETETVLGVLASFKIIKEGDDISVDTENAGVIPIVTHNDKTVYPYDIAAYYLADYTEEQANIHDTKQRFDAEFSIEKMEGIINNTFEETQIIDRIS